MIDFRLCVIINDKQKQWMETFLDKNGTYLQRRKMYIGFPLHNMKSHLHFDWQNQDASVLDQQGRKYKLSQENVEIRKKYAESLDRKIHSKYVQMQDDNEYRQPIDRGAETLEQELENFNHSKISAPSKSSMVDDRPEQATIIPPEAYKISEHTASGLDTINTYQRGKEQNRPEPSPRRHQPEVHKSQYHPIQKGEEDTYRYNRKYLLEEENYNPQGGYQSLVVNRYQPYEPNLNRSYNYELGSSPSKFIQKMHTGTAVNDYPFRNIIPDKLESSLRDKLKADRKSAVKVKLNLFDYSKR